MVKVGEMSEIDFFAKLNATIESRIAPLESAVTELRTKVSDLRGLPPLGPNRDLPKFSPRGPDAEALEAAYGVATDRTTEGSDEFLDTDVRDDALPLGVKAANGISDGSVYMPSSTSAAKFLNGTPDSGGLTVSLGDGDVCVFPGDDVTVSMTNGDVDAAAQRQESESSRYLLSEENGHANGSLIDAVDLVDGEAVSPPLTCWLQMMRYAKAKAKAPDYVLHDVAETWCKVEADRGRQKQRTTAAQQSTVDVTHVTSRLENPFPAGSKIRRSSVVDSATAMHMPTSQNLKNLCSPNITLIHPNSRKRVCWDLLGMMLLTHDLLLIPMQVFETGTVGMPVGYNLFVEKLDMVSACFWTCDMMVSFSTGFYSSEGFLIDDFKRVARHYLSSWFWLDVSIVSTDWLTIFLGLGSNTGYLRLGKTISRVLRVLRLLRFMKMSAFAKELVARVNSEYLLTIGGLVKLVVIIVILNHYIACAWYAMSQVGQERNWSDKFLNHTDSLTMAYVTSLHWSLTQFTPASMEVYPQNKYERMFNSCVIIMAMVTFSSFVSSITSAMTHIRNINARKNEQDSKIRSYFAENKVSHKLAGRIWHFLKTHSGQAGQMVKEDDIPVLKTLPERIRDELCLEVYMPILGVHSLFNIYFSLDPQPMLMVCKKCLELRSFKVAQEVYPDHTRITKMCFVTRGSIEYHHCEDPKKVSKMKHKVQDPFDDDFVESEPDDYLSVGPGQWACELALWVARAQLEGPFAAAVGGVDLVLLDSPAFQAVGKQYTTSSNFLAHYARIFCDRFNICLQDAEFMNLLFDSPVMVSELALDAYEACRPKHDEKTLFGSLLDDAAQRSGRGAIHDTDGEDDGKDIDDSVI